MLLRRALSLALMLTPLAGPPALAQAAHVAAATRPGALTVDSSMGELLDNPPAKAVLAAQIPAMVNSSQIDAARDLTLRQLAQYAPTVLTPEKLAAINAELARTPGAVSSGKPHKSAHPMDPRAALTLETVRLWQGRAPGALGDRPEDIPTLTIVSPGEATNFGSAVIVAPGGGYQALAASLEGRQVADWFAAHGVTAFVLTYRLASSGYAHPTQLLDAERAIRWTRAHASDYGVDPGRIGMIGFSAGGHLTAMAETQFDAGDPKATDPVERVSSRPDFAVLGYPVITAPQSTWSRMGFIGPKTSKDSLAQINPAANVRADTPPTFVWTTTTDQVVPSTNSTAMYDALVAAKVPAELHIFANGRHGMGLGMTDPALGLWPMLLQNWLEGRGLIGPKAIGAR